MDRRSFLMSLAGTALAAQVPSSAEASSLSLAAELDELIESAMRRLAAAAGLSVAVYSREGSYARGFGVTDVTTGQRVDADTDFYIASSTKALTALALAIVARRGDFDLGSSLKAFAPDAPFPPSVQPDQVTFRNLLSHTSGIANDPISFRLAFSGQHDPQLLWQLLQASVVNADAPLGKFSYTNTGYNIATILTDRHLGIAWQDLLDREIFRRAGMHRATARMSTAKAAGWPIAEPHILLPEGITKVYLRKTDATMHSAGGVMMSANDAARWLELMTNEGNVGGRQVVDPLAVSATRERLASVDAIFSGYHREAYGLGWYHAKYRGEPMLHMFGGFAGARSHVSYLPERGIGVAAFVNDSSPATQLADAIANYVYDRTAKRDDARTTFNARMDDLVARRDQYLVKVEADRARRHARQWMLSRPFSAYAGSYDNENYGRIDVSAATTGLEVRFGVMHALAEPFEQPDSIRIELVPQSGDLIGFGAGDRRPATLEYQKQIYRRV